MNVTTSFLNALLLMGTFLFSSQANALSEDRSTGYEILSVQGTVLIWEPFATEWIPAKRGMVPDPQTLLQVRARSSVDIKVVNQRNIGGIGEAQLSFKINRPTIGRLNNEYLRQVKIQKVFFDEIPETEEVPEEEDGEFIALMEEAWERVAAVFSGDEIPLKALEQSLSARVDQDFEVNLQQKRITIAAPGHNSTFTASDFPLERFVYWRAEDLPSESVRYEVRLWKKGTSPQQPLGTTRERKFKLQLYPGEYYLQVSSSDGSMVSQVHTLTVMEAGGLADGKNGVLGQSRQNDDNTVITLVAPPDNFYMITSGENPSIHFQWDNAEDLQVNRKFEFVIATLEGRKVFSKATYDKSVKLRLQPGKYRWWVSAIQNRDSAEQLEISDGFRLIVQEKDDRWISVVSEALLGEGGVVYFDGR